MENCSKMATSVPHCRQPLYTFATLNRLIRTHTLSTLCYFFMFFTRRVVRIWGVENGEVNVTNFILISRVLIKMNGFKDMSRMMFCNYFKRLLIIFVEIELDFVRLLHYYIFVNAMLHNYKLWMWIWHRIAFLSRYWHRKNVNLNVFHIIRYAYRFVIILCCS